MQKIINKLVHYLPVLSIHQFLRRCPPDDPGLWLSSGHTVQPQPPAIDHICSVRR